LVIDSRIPGDDSMQPIEGKIRLISGPAGNALTVGRQETAGRRASHTGRVRLIDLLRLSAYSC
jgi:hypothetical protein